MGHNINLTLIVLRFPSYHPQGNTQLVPQYSTHVDIQYQFYQNLFTTTKVLPCLPACLPASLLSASIIIMLILALVCYAVLCCVKIPFQHRDLPSDVQFIFWRRWQICLVLRISCSGLVFWSFIPFLICPLSQDSILNGITVVL